MSCGCIPRRKSKDAKVVPCEFTSIVEAPSHDDAENKAFGSQKSAEKSQDDESTRPATVADSRVTTPPPFCLEDVAEGNYGVELRRDRASVHWGFVWESQVMERAGERVVEKVTAASIAARYNSENSSRPVNKGDTLVKVNGRGGRMEVIGMELRKNHIFLEFRPGSSSTNSAGDAASGPEYQLPTDLPSSRRAAVLQRRVGERWGIMWDPMQLERCSVRVVESITPDSLADQWNRANPDQAICPGYRLLKVNGIEGRMELHGLEFAKKDRVVLEFIVSGYDS
jgi:hypothetical protein